MLSGVGLRPSVGVNTGVFVGLGVSVARGTEDGVITGIEVVGPDGAVPVPVGLPSEGSQATIRNSDAKRSIAARSVLRFGFKLRWLLWRKPLDDVMR